MASFPEQLLIEQGECNSYSGHGVPGISNAAESALWSIDYMLYGASLGISRFHFHEGVGYAYNAIAPVALAQYNISDGLGMDDRPHIAPLFYGFLFVTEVIGTSGNSYVVELPTVSDNLISYGIYENGQIQRMVLINNQIYTNTTQGGRPGLEVSIQNWKSGQTATVKRLYTPFTNSMHGL